MFFNITQVILICKLFLLHIKKMSFNWFKNCFCFFMKEKIFFILCGGIGLRFGFKKPKQFFKINDKTILEICSENVRNALDLGWKIVYVVEKSSVDDFVSIFPNELYCFGGETRENSVLNGLLFAREKFGNNISYCLVHDVVRPFVSKEVIQNAIMNLEKGSFCVAPFVLPFDTIRLGDKLIDRNKCKMVQTPQGFDFKIGLEIFLKYRHELKTFSDDASLFEKDGLNVKWFAGDVSNFKITTMDDIKMCKKSKIGLGMDFHRFDKNATGSDNFVTLGGVKIPSKFPIIAHSDGDVLIHAVCDAIYGSISFGDIGLHFPPSNQEFKNANSATFLEHALKCLRDKDFSILNVDVMILAEKPKLSGHYEHIKTNLAKIMNLESSQVSIKATTMEKTGVIGSGDGIFVTAIISVF